MLLRFISWELFFRRMRGYFLIIFFLVIVFVVVVYGAPSNSERSDPEVELSPSSNISAPNSLLPIKPKHDTAILIIEDGTVHLVELKSGEVLGSFMSGTAIYNSYQALRNNITTGDDYFYIDRGEDWKLYLHVDGFEKVVYELPFTVEEFLKRTPYTTSNGIMMGSKKTTVFIVDSKTGKLIRTLRSADVLPIEGDTDVVENPILPKKDVEEWEAAQHTDAEAINQLYIVRTDYALKHSLMTGKVLWSLMFAKFEVSQQFNSMDSFHTNPPVHIVSDRKSLESFFAALGAQIALSGDGAPFSISPLFKEFPKIAESSQRADRRKPLLPPSQESGPMALPGGDNQAPFPSAFSVSPLPKPVTEIFESSQRADREPLLPPSQESGPMILPGGDNGQINGATKSDALVQSHGWTSALLGTFMLAVFSVTYLCKRWKLHKQATDHKLQAVTSKKKKSRKSGLSKNSTRSEKSSHNDETEVSGGSPETGKREKILELNLSKYGSLVSHRKIGKLLVSNSEIAKGSNGTIVLEGIYDGRPVAVKRLVQTHHEVALKEIQNLIASDQHPNIVRWYGVEYDQDFVYLSLERCTCSLYELVSSFSSFYQKQFPGYDQDARCFNDCTVQLPLKSGDMEDYPLWKTNGYPSPHLLKLLRDMVLGLVHLHELGIVHRDLKPQNVLVVKDRSICAKLSDMGISKCLAENMSSLTKNSTGSGSSGWQAPEQLRHERQTRAVDLFSLGCVFFFCITGGKHPFGDSLERDINIVNSQKDLFLIENMPEAADLIGELLHPEPEQRPKADEILYHPFFWNSEMRLSFLRDASDRVELEDRENGSKLLEALEGVKTVALGGLWNEKMDAAFINDIGRYRRYKFDSVRDLLRVIRNKLNHYRELSKEIQGILGQVPEGFDSYFSTRFPRLVIEVYKIFHMHCIEEDIFKKYFKGSQI